MRINCTDQLAHLYVIDTVSALVGTTCYGQWFCFCLFFLSEATRNIVTSTGREVKYKEYSHPLKWNDQHKTRYSEKCRFSDIHRIFSYHGLPTFF